MRDHAEYSVPKRMQFMNDDELVNSVWDNINDEINNFREKVKGWSSQEKMDNKEKIRFYEGMTKYLADANIFTDEYRSLYMHGKFILNDLWTFAQKKDYCDSEEEFVYEEFMMWDNAMSM